MTTNLIIPTSGVTMGVLAMAKVPYEKWLKWMAPLMFTFIVAAGIFLLLPIYVFEW